MGQVIDRAAGSRDPTLAPGRTAGAPARRLRNPQARERRIVLLSQVGLLGGLLVAWELAGRSGFINQRVFSYPSEIIERIVSMLGGESLHGLTVFEHLLATGQSLAVGFSIGALLGIVLGFVLGRSALLARVFEPYLLGIYSIPKIAIAPLFVLLFGIGIESKIAVVVMGVFFMVFFSTFSGVLGVNEEHVNIARIMGAGRLAVTRRIIIPAALPSILLGLKMGVPFGVIGAIIGEYIAATKGIGWLIIRSTSFFDASGLFAALFFLVVATWILSQIVALIEARVLRWQPQRRQELVTY
jgi:NitT/TauT family transport system permease protein